MRLLYLKISSFKNLKDFEITFDKESPYSVLVGRNGTGKSNLLEAIVCIFSSLEREEKVNFSYKIKYLLRENEVEIEYDSSNAQSRPQFSYNNSQVLFGNNPNKKVDKYKMFGPEFIFGYYSGTSKRFEDRFVCQQLSYYNKLKDGNRPQRKFFYAHLAYSQFVLLSLLSAKDKNANNFLKDELGIKYFEKVEFYIKEPKRNHKNNDKSDYDSLYNPIKKFVDTLNNWAHKQDSERVEEIKDAGEKISIQYTVFEINTAKRFNEFVSDISFMQYNLFDLLIDAYIADVLDYIKVTVKLNSGETIQFTELSEGEQQLLIVVGLLWFTKENESLFLLDEPDTHLNPAWSLDYLANMKTYGADLSNSHIIMTTHNPLTFAGLNKEEVIVLEKGEDGKIYACPPTINPRGMGVNAILTSDFFALRSALDKQTLEDLDKRRELAFKEKRTPAEDEEFNTLIDKLGNLDFSKDVKDPSYLEYLRAMTNAQNKNPKLKDVRPDMVTWKTRKRIAEEIAERIEFINQSEINVKPSDKEFLTAKEDATDSINNLIKLRIIDFEKINLVIKGLIEGVDTMNKMKEELMLKELVKLLKDKYPHIHYGAVLDNKKIIKELFKEEKDKPEEKNEY